MNDHDDDAPDNGEKKMADSSPETDMSPADSGEKAEASLEKNAQTVRDFVRHAHAGLDVTEEQIISKTEEVLSGIRLDRRVEVKTLRAGDIVCQNEEFNKQSQGPWAAKHEWFAEPGTSAERLGIHGESSLTRTRQQDFFVVQSDVQVLKSTASDVDSWHSHSVADENAKNDATTEVEKVRKQSGELLYGGEEQYYAGPNGRSPKYFQRVVMDRKQNE